MIAFGGRHGAGQIADGRGPSLEGDALVVLSMVIALFWILLNKRLMARHSSVVITAYGALLGLLMLLVGRCRCMLWYAADCGCVGEGLDGAGGEWRVVHCGDDAGMELGDHASAHGVAGGRAVESGAAELGVCWECLCWGRQLGPSAWCGGGLIVAAAVTLTTHSKTRVGGEGDVLPQTIG